MEAAGPPGRRGASPGAAPSSRYVRCTAPKTAGRAIFRPSARLARRTSSGPRIVVRASSLVGPDGCSLGCVASVARICAAARIWSGERIGRGGAGDSGTAGPRDPVARDIRIGLALDASDLLLLVVAEAAEALAVVEAGVTPGRIGPDVVGLSDRSVAEGPATCHVPPEHESRERSRERSCDGFHGDEFAGGRVRVEPPQGGTGGGPVVAERRVHVVLPVAEHTAQLLTDGLGGDRAVALDLGDVAAARGEQGAIGDDDADVEIGGVHAPLVAQQGGSEGVCLDRLVPATVTVCAQLLCFQGETLADLRSVKSWKACRHRRHTVLPRAHGDMATSARMLVALPLTAGIDRFDQTGDLALPPLPAGGIQRRQPVPEMAVDLFALFWCQGRERVRRAVDDVCCDLAAQERVEHLGHRLHEASTGADGTAGSGRRTPGDHRELTGRSSFRLLVGLLDRYRSIAILRGVRQGLGARFPAERIGQVDHRTGLQGIHRGPLFMQTPEHGGIVLRLVLRGPEDRTGFGSELREEEGLITEQLGERSRACFTHTVELTLDGVLSVSVEVVHGSRHAPHSFAVHPHREGLEEGCGKLRVGRDDYRSRASGDPARRHQIATQVRSTAQVRRHGQTIVAGQRNMELYPPRKGPTRVPRTCTRHFSHCG